MDLLEIMIELTFLKELISTKQAHRENVIFVPIGIFQIKGLSFSQMSAMDVMIYYVMLTILLFETFNGLIIVVILVELANLIL